MFKCFILNNFLPFQNVSSWANQSALKAIKGLHFIVRRFARSTLCRFSKGMNNWIASTVARSEIFKRGSYSEAINPYYAVYRSGPCLSPNCGKVFTVSSGVTWVFQKGRHQDEYGDWRGGRFPPLEFKKKSFFLHLQNFPSLETDCGLKSLLHWNYILFFNCKILNVGALKGHFLGPKDNFFDPMKVQFLCLWKAQCSQEGKREFPILHRVYATDSIY